MTGNWRIAGFTSIIAVGLLAACVHAPDIPREVEPLAADEVYAHKWSTVQFPPSAGRLVRKSVTEYDGEGYNSSGHYTNGSLGAIGTAYFYPGGTEGDASQRSIEAHFAQTRADVLRATSGARLVTSEVRTFRINRSKTRGFYAEFELPSFGDVDSPMRSFLFLVPVQGWYLKFRLSQPIDSTEGDDILKDFINGEWWPE